MKGVLMGALLVLVASGCGLLGPDEGADVAIVGERRLFPVPPFYLVAYVAAEKCLEAFGYEQRASFSDVKWFVADDIFTYDGIRVTGVWRRPHDIIIWRNASDHHRPTIRHESAHHAGQIGDEIHSDDIPGSPSICDHFLASDPRAIP